MKSNNFDKVAFVYDFLVRIFFGTSLKKAQSYFLNKIPNDAKILVLGSGTGWVAEEILKQNSEFQIILIDASEKMTQRARKKLTGKPVDVLCADESKLFTVPFDVVILPCFMDLFPDQKLKPVIESIKRNMKPGSAWIITEFVSTEKWHRIYLWVMYRFFKWTCNIETNQLPDWQSALSESNIKVKERKTFYGGFIHSTYSYLNN